MIRPRRERASERTRPVSPGHDAEVAKLGDIAGEAGLERVSILAWRDLDDPEAGGSEVHAANIASLWAEAGIEVTMRTSYAANYPMVSWRDGYRVIRKAGRYLVFPRAAFSEMMGWHGGRDGLVEIWNGMPFFSPLWARTAHVTWLHHVHAEMWRMTLPPRLAAFGNFIESRVAPPIYRRTPIVTLSESSKQELVHDLHFRADRVTVVSPGIDPQFTPGGEKSPEPLVVGVGRLVPVKRYDMLIDALVALKPRHPGTPRGDRGRGLLAGPTSKRRSAPRAPKTGSAFRVASTTTRSSTSTGGRGCSSMTSSREGWGMIVTEAAACGTPAVVDARPGLRRRGGRGANGVARRHPRRAHRRSRHGALRLRPARTARYRRARARGPLHLGGDGTRHPRGARAGRDPASHPPVTVDAHRASCARAA